jgi:hypothetical protein
LKLAKPKTLPLTPESSPESSKKSSNEDKKKKSKKKKKNNDDSMDIEKYFDNSNFDSHLHFTPQIQAKLIATHPLLTHLLAVYEKSEVQIIWLDTQSMTQVKKHLTIDNKQEIK